MEVLLNCNIVAFTADVFWSFGASRSPVLANSGEKKLLRSISAQGVFICCRSSRQPPPPPHAQKKVFRSFSRRWKIAHANHANLWHYEGAFLLACRRKWCERASKRESDIKDGYARGARRVSGQRKGKRANEETSSECEQVAMTGCSRDSMLVVSCVCARYGLREVLEKK